jgi:Cytochrome C oxidase, cbb3-type, subunit III
MKKALKILGSIFVLLVLVLAGVALYIQTTGLPRYPKPPLVLEVKATPERVARGARLAKMLCVGCHYDPTTRVLSGRRMPDVPPEFGVICSANITRDPAHGIASWTDGEIAWLLRTGIRRDGRYVPPYMVKLPHASDEDVASIIAFLRSDDPLVAPNPAPTHVPEVSFLTKVLSRVAFKPFPYPAKPMTAPDPADTVAYGRYLTDGLLDCYSCHSADFKTNDYFDPPKSPGYYGGSNALLDANGRTVYSANITPDPETGIGSWTEAQFVHALKGGFRPSGTPVLYPMQIYVDMTDEEAQAVYAYLKTVPPIHKTRPARTVIAVAQDAGRGKQVYYKYSCNSCHGDEGVGLYDLRHALRKYPTDANLEAYIRDPSAKVPDIKMPTWEGVIQDDEYTPLVNYVKTLQLPPS